MGLYGIMTTSVSGMSVQADRMGTVADNIANINTTGYRRATAEFSTLVPEARVVQYQPGAVETHVRRNVEEQGELAYTRSPTDLAIKGNGFMLVRGATEVPYLTRAGSFVPNGDGELVNAGGFKLLGYNLLSGNLSSIVNSAAGLEVVGTANLGLRASASTQAELQFNLPSTANSTLAANLPSTNTAGSEYVGKTSMVTYDSLGERVVVDVYTAKTSANNWEVSVYNNSQASSVGGFPYSSGPMATMSMSFDGTTGQLASSSPSSVSVNIPNGSTMEIDFTRSTQLAADYIVQAAEVNGNSPAKVERLDISSDGIVSAVYENGVRVDAFKIPLANVTSPNNLTLLSGNVFLPNNDSGDMQIGVAGAASLGGLVSGALERPTVDLATELTTMVEAQRSYTANSKVFQTGAELMDVLVNLKR